MKTTKNNSEPLPPFCPSCDKQGKVWRTAKRRVEQIFRDELFSVNADVTECTNCRFHIVTIEQGDAILQNVADAFRRTHNLLTSREILARRHAMELSQAEFSMWLGVGVASVKRWEQALVQDKGSDLLIRERTAHVIYDSDIYPLTQPQADTHVFVSVSGFRNWLGKTKEVATKTFAIQASLQISTNLLDDYAFTATA